jgi:hypothetical protein
MIHYLSRLARLAIVVWNVGDLSHYCFVNNLPPPSKIDAVASEIVLVGQTTVDVIVRLPTPHLAQVLHP